MKKSGGLEILRVRNLDLKGPSSLGRPPYLSAASGLVRLGDWLYIVADDELHLGVFQAKGKAPGDLMRLFPGALPLNAKKRKKKKPDLESIVRTPLGLLAIPSGSKPNRTEGCLLGVGVDGRIGGRGKTFRFEKHFERLSKIFKDLNIEGAVCTGDSLLLAQRGNSKSGENAIIEYDLNSFFSKSPTIKSVRWYDLGKTAGVSFGFTDLSALPNGQIVFSAAAEDSANPFEDAPCAGSAIGVLDSQGRMIFKEGLNVQHKIEGVHARKGIGGIEVLMVNDDDDPLQVAGLFKAVLPL